MATFWGTFSYNLAIFKGCFDSTPRPDSTIWYPVDSTTIRNFSAVCWLSGRDLFERFGGEVPVGLAMNAVGAHPIESWLGPDQVIPNPNCFS